MSSPTISVALCTFQGERFIARQLDSILAGQELPDEIVVSDDGSRDATLEIVRSTLAHLGRVTLLRNESPLGVTANFAQAIAATNGDVVILSDQDDVWMPDRVASARRLFAERSEILLSFGDAYLIDAEGAALDATLFGYLGVAERDLRAIEAGGGFNVLLRRNLATGATVSFRRQLLETAAPLPPEWVHDEWLALAAAARGGLHVDRAAHVAYRLHGSNQIGADKPTFRRKVRRMFRSEPDRNDRLAGKWQVAAERAEGWATPDHVAHALRQKGDFEARRARFPRSRLLRWPRVLREAARGGYRTWASQGSLDVVRDLVQPR